jgi:5-deoxy-glucuronate isomerase
MPELLVRPVPPDPERCIVNITPTSAGWRYVGFAVHRMAATDRLDRRFAGRETCIVILSGTVDIRAGARSFDGIEGRASVFEDRPPHAVYLDSDTPFTIRACAAAEIALCTAPSAGTRPPRLIEPGQIGTEVRGEGTNRRLVRNVLPETEPADSLLIAEVITPGGHWSSYPPHKHDADNPPEESALEETYYHRLDPPQGFAFQRVYTDDRGLDETLCVHDGDVVLVPRGYHPVGAPHGYDLYYLNVMAGPRRTWIFNNDPEHAWLLAD